MFRKDKAASRPVGLISALLARTSLFFISRFAPMVQGGFEILAMWRERGAQREERGGGIYDEGYVVCKGIETNVGGMKSALKRFDQI